MENLEAAFDNPQRLETTTQQYSNQGGYHSNNNYNNNGGYNKGNNNWKNGNNWKNKSGTKKPTLNKDTVQPHSLDLNKIHFSLNYRCYGGVIASNVEILDQNLLSRMKTLIDKLEAKGYLFRGNDPKEGMQDYEKKNKQIFNSMATEIDKIYSGFAFGNDITKEKHFGVVRSMHNKYADLKDVIKSFLAKDVGLICGENLNRPITLCLIIALPNIDIKEETDYKKLGNLNFLINVLKATNRPFFNIANDDEYTACVEFVDKLP